MTTAPAPPQLFATTREVEATDDLLARIDASGFAWLHHDTRIVANGVAARVAVDDVHDLLASITVDDEVELPAVGPLAVGALPFDPVVPGELVIPSIVVAHVDGRAFETRIGDGEASRSPSSAPTRFVVDATRSPSHWRAMVERALESIDAGGIDKVVLAREVVIEGDAPFDVGAIVRRLTTQQPGSFVYASEGLVGASPELLARRVGDRVESRPMAGTTVVDGDAASLRALAESVKDQREHRYVVDAITEALEPVCTELEIGVIPEIAVFGHVAHLATPFRGRLHAPAPSALALARLLHPTPAVGGTPTMAAVEAIRELEGFDRGRYAGPVGWVDARGDGEWAIALRGAEIDGSRARLVAGAGIVAGSDPDAEWAETQAKFEPMLRALVRP
ncbi:MAG TPA: isochorismate synthase [Acidimicrobiia bacterium]|nr:isochorismate synthase [Acidimicrobiia bacterium]